MEHYERKFTESKHKVSNQVDFRNRFSRARLLSVFSVEFFFFPRGITLPSLGCIRQLPDTLYNERISHVEI